MTVNDITIQHNQIHISDEEGNSTPLLDEKKLAIEVSEAAKCRIARTLCRLVPSLADGKKRELLDYVFQVLETLTSEQITRVKRIIAEELKDSPDASHELIMNLAWDDDINVSTPVLRFSPKLTDDDLLEIIRHSKIPGVLDAIAERNTVSSRIAHAITKRGFPSAVTRLLSNKKASIEENLLEEVIEQAPEHESWHAPLVQRVELTNRMLCKLAGFVSETLIEALHQEGKINDLLHRKLTACVPERLTDSGADRTRSAELRVRELYDLGMLEAEHLETAIAHKDREFVVEALTMLSCYDRDKVSRILSSGNGKAVTALSWKAGMPMRIAMQLQLYIARVPHPKLLYARGGTEYPIDANEMAVYLDLFDHG